jgi:anti-sigma regulatory factor (Ser/Thr protein kinase)
VTYGLNDKSDSVRTARRFVHDQLLARGAKNFVDDATVVAAELLANACQHGTAPVSVSVSGAAGHVRVAVRDASSRTPVRPNRSTNNMTGRGILLVEALSSRWGVSIDEQGKVVWAEFGVTAPDDPLQSVQAVEELSGVESSAASAAELRYTVVLGDVPTDLLIEAKAHMDNLVRELSLAAADD